VEAWFAIVDATVGCKRYEYVLVKKRGISGGCFDEAAAGKYFPRTRATNCSLRTLEKASINRSLASDAPAFDVTKRAKKSR
jgi:hypothetical protein